MAFAAPRLPTLEIPEESVCLGSGDRAGSKGAEWQPLAIPHEKEVHKLPAPFMSKGHSRLQVT